MGENEEKITLEKKLGWRGDSTFDPKCVPAATFVIPACLKYVQEKFEAR